MSAGQPPPDPTKTTDEPPLYRGVADLRESLAAHGQIVMAMAFDPTGTRLAVASSPAKNREHLPMSEGGHAVGDPQSGRVWIIKVPGGEVLHEFELPSVNAEWNDPDGCSELDMDADYYGDVGLAFSPDSAWLAVVWVVHLDPQVDIDCEAIAILDLERGEIANSGNGAANPLADGEYRNSTGEDGGLVAAFAPDNRTLVSACVVWGKDRMVRCVRASEWELVADEDVELELCTGARIGFSDDGETLVMADITGVTFVDAVTRERRGRSRGARQEQITGPLVVAADGSSALTVGRVQRGETSEEGLWRWRPRATPELVARCPGTIDEGWRVLWIHPDGREVLWCDPDNALVRQHVPGQGDASTGRPELSIRLTRVKELALADWEVVAASADGRRIARTLDGRVLVTRLRRRAEPLQP